MRILIADDEQPIREWLHFCIEQQFPGEFEYDLAGNGALAYELFLQYHHEIILADIKMPMMTGLELAEKIYAFHLDSYVIILTSYNDFDFVRRALKHNIKNYILKTEITDSLIHEVVSEARAYLSRPEEKPLSIAGDVRDFFSMSFEECRNLICESGQTLPAKNYFFLGVCSQNETASEIVLPLNNSLKPAFKMKVSKEVRLICIELLTSPSTLLQIQTIHLFLDTLSSQNPSCFFSATRPNDNVRNLQGFMKQAMDALALSFYDCQRYCFDPVLEYDVRQEINLRYLKVKKDISSHTDAVGDSLEHFFDLIAEKRPLDIDYIRMLCRSIVEQTLHRTYQNNFDLFSEENMRLEHEVNACRNLGDLQSLVSCVCARTYRENFESLNCSEAIQQALNYIHKNYAVIEGMTEVTRYVCLNPEYFSRLFKKEVGCNFSNYLNKVRLLEAARLLDETDLKVFEVAEKTGFSSLSYFSRKFKAQFGLNPFKYMQTKNQRV